MQDTIAIDATVLDQIRAIEPPGEDLVGTVIRVFIDESKRLGKCIEDAIADRNCEAVRKYAHSLKSCSGNVGALKVAALSQEMEAAGREAQDDRLVKLLPSLTDNLDLAIAELEALQASRPGA